MNKKRRGFELADDVLVTAAKISLFLYGTEDMQRKVYHLAATSRLPCFRLGSQICVRKSTLRAYIESQEGRSLNESEKRLLELQRQLNEVDAVISLLDRAPDQPEDVRETLIQQLRAMIAESRASIANDIQQGMNGD